MMSGREGAGLAEMARMACPSHLVLSLQQKPGRIIARVVISSRKAYGDKL